MRRTAIAAIAIQALLGLALTTLALILLVWPQVYPANWEVATYLPQAVLGAGVAILLVATWLLTLRVWPYLPPLPWSQLLEQQVARLEVTEQAVRRQIDKKTIALEAQLADARSRLASESATRQAVESELQVLSRGLERFPKELLTYYSNGVHGHGSDEVRGLAKNITAPWKAVESTMSVELLDPFFDQVQRVVKAHDAPNPVHHYSSAEVLRMLETISEAWRRDEWFQKALRWMQQRYATR